VRKVVNRLDVLGWLRRKKREEELKLKLEIVWFSLSESMRNYARA
jgi:hypothetical protein